MHPVPDEFTGNEDQQELDENRPVMWPDIQTCGAPQRRR